MKVKALKKKIGADQNGGRNCTLEGCECSLPEVLHTTYVGECVGEYLHFG